MKSRIRKILIANRGEVVSRIIATCRLMGIRTVAIHSDEDAGLPFTWDADEIAGLGPGNVIATYLDMVKILDIAKARQVDAIHPGYGFLSENMHFARRVAEAGLVFIGPRPEHMEMMGNKIQARDLVRKLGVPVSPGCNVGPDDSNLDMALLEKIGYPLLIKAASGGGGKGMKIVESAAQLRENLQSAAREALNAFGDGTLFVEKLLAKPRHIEVQVFSDAHGRHFHLHTRECSIQRRHQKIIEEAPVINLSKKVEQSMIEESLKITRHIQYLGAGTMEFMVDEKGEHYFLEMNTRLQVEHAVTEMITGLDLVRLQIECASGMDSGLEQTRITTRGHAIEARLYAEDPATQFMPSAGVVEKLVWPRGQNIRLDNGYEEGDRIGISYDPLLAKITTLGVDREDARLRLLDALNRTFISGIKCNLHYLKRVLQEKDFSAGKVHTGYIQAHNELLSEPPLDGEQLARALARYMLKSSGMQGRKPQPGLAASETSVWEHSSLRNYRNS